MMNKNLINYLLLLIILSIVPTYLIHLLIKFFWDKDVVYNTSITTLESFVTMLLLPVYLLIISYVVNDKFKINYVLLILNLLIMFFCVWLSAYFHFKNWSISIGNKFNPDEGTLEVIGFTKLVGYIICIIGFLYLIYSYKKKSKR